MSTGAPMGGGVITGRDGVGNPIVTYYASGPQAPTGARLNVWDFWQETDQWPVLDHALMFNRAIAAGVAQYPNGFTVYAPAYLYILNSPIILSAANVRLVGDGGQSGNTNASPALGATILQPAAGFTGDVITTPLPPVVGTAGFVVYGVSVRDLVIDCSLMAGTLAGQGNGIHFYGVRYGHVSRVHVFHCPNWAFLMDGDATNYSYNIVLRDCVAGQCAAGIRFSNSEQGTVDTCIIEGAGLATAAAQPYGSASPTTQANHLYANSGWIMARGCNFGTSGTYTQEAVRADNGEPLQLIGCLWDSPHGMALYCTTGGVAIVTGCTFSSPGTTTAGPAIRLDRGGSVIIGNIFAGPGANMTYCVQEFGAQVGTIVEGNQIVAGTAGKISINTGSTGYRVANNAGYNPVGHGVNQPAVPASGTAQTNQSGVDCMVYVTGGTVSAISVNGTATGLTSGAVRVPGGQTITLTYSASPSWVWMGD